MLYIIGTITAPAKNKLKGDDFILTVQQSHSAINQHIQYHPEVPCSMYTSFGDIYVLLHNINIRFSFHMFRVQKILHTQNLNIDSNFLLLPSRVKYKSKVFGNVKVNVLCLTFD